MLVHWSVLPLVHRGSMVGRGCLLIIADTDDSCIDDWVLLVTEQHGYRSVGRWAASNVLVFVTLN